MGNCDTRDTAKNIKHVHTLKFTMSVVPHALLHIYIYMVLYVQKLNNNKLEQEQLLFYF